MKKEIRIGERAFQTKAAATTAVRAILYAYSPGQTIGDPDHYRFLQALLSLHPEAEQKIGCGVYSFQVERNGPTVGFWLTRIDGSRTDWSFVSCLTPKTPEQDALSALRLAIRPQILAFRDSAFSGVAELSCALTGAMVSAESCHIDHEVPFASLVTAWLSASGLSLGGLRVVPTEDGETRTRLADASVETSWQRSHKESARLRVVSAEANLRRAR